MGGHTHAPAGLANNGAAFRALFDFDVAASIPMGATINSVIFQFDVSRQGGPLGRSGASFDLHRLSTEWVEGVEAGNLGGPSPNGATWLDASTGSTAWTTPGGDFAGANSGSVFIDWFSDGAGIQTYSILSNTQLVADVQNMLDNSTSDFGFLLKANDEINPLGSAMRINTLDETTGGFGAPARLIIDFTPIPEPGSAIIVGIVGLCCGMRRRR